MIKRLGISLLCLALCHSTKATEDELEIVSKALDILDPWYAQNPKPSDRKLHIICWRPIDRAYAKNYRQRLRRIMEHIRNFYADEMERTGFGRRTFQLNYDEFGELIIHEAIGDSEFADYTKPEREFGTIAGRC
ncbi:MAG: hypothetical protein P1V20_14005 [Verrucomicrobiales bacterium]|nr:hypothetical protein [Verrucomicrobiales bacterium]